MTEKYILIDKKAVKTAFFIFFIGSIVGVVVSVLLLKYNHAPTNLPLAIKSENTSLDFITILMNNIFVALFMISGAYLAKIPTILSLFGNGFFLGFIMATNIYTTSAVIYFLRLVMVHGVVEIMALLLAANLGLQKEIFSTPKKIKRSAITIFIVLILLAIAALLETMVTPLLW